MKAIRNLLLALLLLFFLSLALSQGEGEDIAGIFAGLVMLTVPTYIFIRCLLPPMWRYIIKPMGKLAYFSLLFLSVFSFLLVRDAGDLLDIPEETRFILLVVVSAWGGWRWAQQQGRRK